MTNIQEFAIGCEAVTATMTLPQDSIGNEHFGPPLTIGVYPGQPEIWIEGECGRQNIPVQHVAGVIKQLRRAAAIALENSVKE